MIKRTGQLVLIVVFIAAISSCSLWKKSATQTTSIKPLGDTMNVNDGSLIYSLPMTVFNITVEFQHTIDKPGPYARYASEMLGLKDVIIRENESWSISGISLASTEELDPSEFYVIESNTIAGINALSLKKSGLILDINPSLYESEKMQQTGYGSGQKRLAFSDLGADEYYMSQSDTAYRLVKLDTTFVRIPYLVERKKVLSADQLAERAAKALLELRDGKQFILTGEGSVFPQSNAGIDEINRLEKEYTALFAGKTITETKTLIYSYIPVKESSAKPETLFRFSETSGPSDTSSSTGTPVAIELIPAEKIKDVTIISKPAANGQPSQSFDKLFYRIPDVVTVRIKSGNRKYFEARKLVYQFGQVVQLPANYIIGK